MEAEPCTVTTADFSCCRPPTHRIERSSMPVPSSRGASMGRLRLVDSRPIWVATSATSAGRRMLHTRQSGWWLRRFSEHHGLGHKA